MSADTNRTTDRIPNFDEPKSFLSPEISNLIEDGNHLYEDGTLFKGYKRCNPDDASEVLKSAGRSLNFLFQVPNWLSLSTTTLREICFSTESGQ